MWQQWQHNTIDERLARLLAVGERQQQNIERLAQSTELQGAEHWTDSTNLNVGQNIEQLTGAVFEELRQSRWKESWQNTPDSVKIWCFDN